MKTVLSSAATICALLAGTVPSAGQQPGPAAGQAVQLRDLQAGAIETDPRLRELQLEARQTELRLHNITAGRLPSVTVEGQVQSQSDVPRAPFTLAGGQPIFTAPKTTYDGSLRVDQSLFDATLGAQAAFERAQLAEAQAHVKTALFAVRQQVNDAFFAAVSLQGRASALDATIGDLEARLTETTARVQNGAALAADAAMVEATILQRRQDVDELRANRHAALARLTTLTGRAVGDADALVLPDLAGAVAEARRASQTVRARPEYEEFARTRERLARQQDAVTAQSEPRLAAFARLGYGKPGLNFISNHFESYGVGGVQIQWHAWTWGAASREREAIALQQEVIAADEAAFARTVDTATEDDLAAIDRLARTLETDARIITLREQVAQSMRPRLQEGVVTAAEYLDREADLLQARLARTAHQIELAQASARLLTTLGLEVR